MTGNEAFSFGFILFLAYQEMAVYYSIQAIKTYSLLCCSRGTKFLQSLREDVQSQASSQPGILVIF